MRSALLFVLAGLLEIGGGYLVWLWLREHRPLLLGLVGFLLLAAYGIVPAFQPTEHPFARVYAAYGAVFIVISMLWGWGIDHAVPDFKDCLGASLCLAGSTIMMWPRT